LIKSWARRTEREGREVEVAEQARARYVVLMQPKAEGILLGNAVMIHEILAASNSTVFQVKIPIP
jgi:hypothetical protein